MLDKRLLACAQLVRQGVKVCDVGTDHGYLPCYLIKNGIASYAIAADVNKKPLESAKKTVKEYGLENRITLILSDGLKEISKQDADDVVIAGMGGELIVRLVLACDWLRSCEKNLILQPMTQSSYLRKKLLEEGFQLVREIPVCEGGHHYSVMLWNYCGIRREIDELEALVGKIPEVDTKESKAYLIHQRERILKIAEGLKRSKEQSEQANGYFKLADQIFELLSQKEIHGK